MARTELTFHRDGYYSSIVFTPHLQRQGAFYMINVICPAMFMALMATFSFYLPSESNEKASLAVTMFLAQMVLDIIIVQYLPMQSEVIPIIGACIIIIIIVQYLPMQSEVIPIIGQYLPIQSEVIPIIGRYLPIIILIIKTCI